MSDPFPFQSTPVHSPPRGTGGARAQVQVGQRGVRVGGGVGGVQGVGPDLGPAVGRASAVWAGALGLQIFGLSSWEPQDPLPIPSSMILGVPLPAPPGSRGDWQWTGRAPPGPAGSRLRGPDPGKARLTLGPTGVEWPLAGGERLTVTRAMGPGGGTPGPVRALCPPTALPTVPAPQDQEGETGATRAWHLLGGGP